MKNLLMTVVAFGCLSVTADPYSFLEARACKRQLKKSLKKEKINYSKVRYQGAAHSYPLIHEFAVYEKGSGEPIEVVQMVKVRGSKCTRY